MRVKELKARNYNVSLDEIVTNGTITKHILNKLNSFTNNFILLSKLFDDNVDITFQNTNNYSTEIRIDKRFVIEWFFEGDIFYLYMLSDEIKQGKVNQLKGAQCVSTIGSDMSFDKLIVALSELNPIGINVLEGV